MHARMPSGLRPPSPQVPWLELYEPGEIHPALSAAHIGCVHLKGPEIFLEYLPLRPSRTLWGSWVPLCSPLLVCKGADSSLHNLPRVPKGRFKQLLIKGGRAKESPETRGEKSEEFIKKISREQTGGPAQTLHIACSCQQPHP